MSKRNPKMQQYFLWKQLPLFLLGMFWSSLMNGQSSLVSIQTVDTDCGMNTGSIQLTPQLSGSYTYQWSTGAISSSISGLAIGDYACTITQGSTTEVIQASIYRPWELERFILGDTTVSIIGNTATINPNLVPSAAPFLDQRTHVYDKTPIDVETQTGSIFAKFSKTHANFPNQWSNPNSTAPPVFYVELFPVSDVTNSLLNPIFVLESNFALIIGGRLPEKIFTTKGVNAHSNSTYTGHVYTGGEELEFRFLGNHQLEVYLGTTLIHSTTIPQLASTNKYVAAIGFNDHAGLDRRIAYDLKSTFCSSMPLVKTTITHSQKYGATGKVDLSVQEPKYMNATYTYNWSNGATNASIQNLSRGNYTVTISNDNGNAEVLSTQVNDKLEMQAASDVGIVKIVNNSMTCDPAIPMQSISDYRTHAYDPKVPINVERGGGSVWVRFSANHPNFPDQHSNTDNYNAVFVLRLQEALDPLPVPTFFLDYPFQMVFYTDGGVKTSNRSTTWAGPYQSIPNVKYHKGGYDIELRFLGNRVVAIYMNDVQVGTRTLTGTAEEYYFMVGFSDDASRQRRIAYNLLTSFESEAPIVYAELKEELDGGYYQLTDDHLRFKFTQEYAVNTGGESIAYKIYKWDRTSNAGTFVSTYGTNWVDIDLSNYNLANDSYYTIEFEGNKEQKYILRFKTKSN